MALWFPKIRRIENSMYAVNRFTKKNKFAAYDKSKPWANRRLRQCNETARLPVAPQRISSICRGSFATFIRSVCRRINEDKRYAFRLPDGGVSGLLRYGDPSLRTPLALVGIYSLSRRSRKCFQFSVGKTRQFINGFVCLCTFVYIHLFPRRCTHKKQTVGHRFIYNCGRVCVRVCVYTEIST